jgi:hypothetical protein
MYGGLEEARKMIGTRNAAGLFGGVFTVAPLTRRKVANPQAGITDDQRQRRAAGRNEREVQEG